MANRPWVMPQEVQTYSSSVSVRSRDKVQLTMDITRAEQYVIAYTHNKFEECEEIPEAVRTAVILLAEAYAMNSTTYAKGVKSETFDDYSYTAADTVINARDMDLAALLDDYVITDGGGRKRITMRMRRL